ncbi:hypothetical protein DFH11DRAFT_1722506 [Phellopilus nigrolimitatus]|nr:hypothetical protein DFH11DRAFT_1722506 [Phellopilus nigrolimitatus]
MTRYTNIGRKRSYIEAGFSEDKAENEDATEILPTVDNAEITTGDTQPTKKKRKRTKHKPDNCEKAPVNVVSGGGANEGETRDEDQEVKNAYKNRDKNRKDNVPNTVVLGTSNDTGADEDDFHTFKRMSAEVDFEERHETRAKKKADVKMGVMSKTVKSFASAPLAGAKKVIFF